MSIFLTWLVRIVGWPIIFLLFAAISGFSETENQDDSTELILIFSLWLGVIFFYYGHRYLMRKLLRRQRYMRYVNLIFTTGIPLSGFATFVFTFSNDNFVAGFMSNGIKLIYFSGFFMFLAFLLSTNFQITIFRDWFSGVHIEDRLFKSQISLLKIQLSPHLFKNMLNNIYSLVLLQKPEAPDALIRLQGVMEYILYKTNKPRIELQKEIDFIQELLVVERLRLPSNYSLRLEISGDPKGKYIIPLLLLPFVENAFRHGDLSTVGFINIKINIEDTFLEYSVINAVSPRKNGSSNKSLGGLGLTTLKNRLDLAYTGLFSYSLDCKGGQDQYEAKLSVFDLKNRSYEQDQV